MRHTIVGQRDDDDEYTFKFEPDVKCPNETILKHTMMQSQHLKRKFKQMFKKDITTL